MNLELNQKVKFQKKRCVVSAFMNEKQELSVQPNEGYEWLLLTLEQGNVTQIIAHIGQLDKQEEEVYFAKDAVKTIR